MAVEYETTTMVSVWRQNAVRNSVQQAGVSATLWDNRMASIKVDVRKLSRHAYCARLSVYVSAQ